MNPQYPYQPQQPQPVPQQQAYAPVPPPVPSSSYRRNSSNKWLIIAFVFIFTTLTFGGLFTWALVNYMDQKNNVDSKVANAVALAVKEQKEADAAAAAEAEKEPNRLFRGPEDYGSLSFKYPKTWSAYEAQDANDGGTYEAYFNPGLIPPASQSQRYALRITIEDQAYQDVVDGYQSLVESGDVKPTAITINDQNGTRLDGKFNEDVRGSVVILKIRDKTVTLRTDATTFTKDFNALIKTVTFNK